jgi:hypothetical protein
MTPPTSSHSAEPAGPTNEPPPAPAVSTNPPCAEDEPIQIPPAILEAQAAFERDLPRLLKERPGQWVAYLGEKPIAFAATSVALCQACWRQGHREFLLRCIEPYPDMDFISGW